MFFTLFPREFAMSRHKWTKILVITACSCLLASLAFAHHMGRGYGSAPEVVDDYAHGASAVQTRALYASLPVAASSAPT